jgi:hypothetical protein
MNGISKNKRCSSSRLNALVLRDSVEGRESAAEEQEIRVSGFGSEELAIRRDGISRAGRTDSSAHSEVLEGRTAPKEKADERFPTAIELRMAALAPTTEADLQSVEIVDMRWSTTVQPYLGPDFARCVTPGL